MTPACLHPKNVVHLDTDGREKCFQCARYLDVVEACGMCKCIGSCDGHLKQKLNSGSRATVVVCIYCGVKRENEVESICTTCGVTFKSDRVRQRCPAHSPKGRVV